MTLNQIKIVDFFQDFANVKTHFLEIKFSVLLKDR